MADQSAGRVSLHPCFRQGLWTASLEITGEGGTPALSCRRIYKDKTMIGYEGSKVCFTASMATIVMAVFLLGCDARNQEEYALFQRQNVTRNGKDAEAVRAREEAEKERARIEAAKKAEKEAKKQEETRRKKQALKIIELEVLADKKLVEALRNELESVDEDRKELMSRFDAIDIPKVICRTNEVKLANGRMKKKVERIKLSEDQRLKERLMTLYEDQAMRDIYLVYTDSTAKKVLDEFESEWTDANDKYEEVTVALQKVDEEEQREKDQLSANFRKTRSRRINQYRRKMEKIQTEMKPLKKKISEHQSGRCRIRSMIKAGGGCNCDISTWTSQFDELRREYSDYQSKLNAENSTAIGQEENRQISGITSRASQKRAKINQEYTHQTAVLKEIVDKHNRLLMENLIVKMKDRKEYLIRRIAEVTGKNEVKARYLDGRMELSPKLALDFIKNSERKNADMLGVERRSESEDAHQRRLDLIKETNTIRITSDAKVDVNVKKNEL